MKKRIKLLIGGGVALILLVAASIHYADVIMKADVNPDPTPVVVLPVNNARFVYLNNPLIQGTAIAGSHLSILDGTNVIGTTITESSGRFYFKPVSSLSNGTHKLQIKDNNNNLTSSATYINIDTSDSSKAILKSQGPQIIENDHPYYGSGTNYYISIMKIMQDPQAVEAEFAKMEKAGVKMTRIINYMLDDMKLPDPTEAPTASPPSDGGSMPAGNYIYRYTCANLSKTVNAYNIAETLPSPVTSAISVLDNQKVTLTLSPCAQSYRYLIYRRLASDPADSEKYLTYVKNEVNKDVIFTDSGSITIPADPTVAPTLTTQAADPNNKSYFTPGDYTYRFASRKEANGISSSPPATGFNSISPTQTIAVSNNQLVKVSIPTSSGLGSKISIYRKKSDGNEEFLKVVSNNGNPVQWIDNGSAGTDRDAPQTDKTTPYYYSTQNETKDNPREGPYIAPGKPFMTGFGNWNQDTLKAADDVMVLAKKYNIRILFTFVDQHDNLTGGIREIARNCAVGNSAFFSDNCPRNMMKEIIEKFTNRYKDDPAIFAWELTNEAYEINGGWRTRTWLTEMGDYLKSIDPNHMLSSGIFGGIWFTHNYQDAWNGNNNNDFVTAGMPDSIDLLTWHGYPQGKDSYWHWGGYRRAGDPSKLDGVSDANQPNQAWWDYWGQHVYGPIDINTAIKEMERHAHYAYLLDKPVIFGEWGLSKQSDWKTQTGADWVTALSNAILTVKPDLVKGNDTFPDGNFSRPLSDGVWKIGAGKADLAIDNDVTYNNHSTLKITPNTQYMSGVESVIFPVKPNTKYWYEFTGKNPTSRDLRIRINFYKGDEYQNRGWGYGGNITKDTNNWKTISRFNNNLCEFTTPADIDGMTIELTFWDGTSEAAAWIGQLRVYELTEPTDINNSTFASTGWWDMYGSELEYLMDPMITAAKNFEIASVADLPPLGSRSSDDDGDGDTTPPPDINPPPAEQPTDTSQQNSTPRTATNLPSTKTEEKTTDQSTQSSSEQKGTENQGEEKTTEEQSQTKSESNNIPYPYIIIAAGAIILLGAYLFLITKI
ncbi:MAG: cellulase family glycosylhydrolase [Candidatus Berkelbacteria bacterium]|nr:cellulase family glycosylhydrolase [Candidatus Berkelbacteria bacterium]